MAGKKKKVLSQKPEDVKVGSVEEFALKTKLKKELEHTDDNFMGFVSRMYEFENKRNQPKSQIDRFTRMYYQQCLLAMGRPLSEGLSVESAIQCAGMYAGMAIFSKEFRDTIKDTSKDMLYSYASHKAMKDGPGSRWYNQWEKMNRDQFKEDHGRYPMDAHTAAIMELGFCRGAYNQMRVEGADPKAVMDSYKQAVEVLHKEAQSDGVKLEDIHKEMQRTVGMLVSEDYNSMQYFNETAYQGVGRADFTPGKDKDGKDVLKWDGTFVNMSGNLYTGGFTPRMPGGKSFYEAKLHYDFDDTYINCKDIDELHETYYSREATINRDMTFKMMFQDGMSEAEIGDIGKAVFEDQFRAWAENNPKAYEDACYIHEYRQEASAGPYYGYAAEGREVSSEDVPKHAKRRYYDDLDMEQDMYERGL